MGCCLCRPLAEVQEDPDILFHNRVGDIAVFKHDFNTYKVLGGYNGIMYVKDGYLYYEARCGRRICCACCKQRFSLAEIRSINVLHNQSITFHSGRHIHGTGGHIHGAGGHIHGNPGRHFHGHGRHFHGRGGRHIHRRPVRHIHQIVLSPGLKITVGNDTVVLVSTPDAAELAQKIRGACNHIVECVLE